MFVVANETPHLPLQLVKCFPQCRESQGGAKGQEARRSRENGAVGAEERNEFIQFPSKLSTYQNVNE